MNKYTRLRKIGKGNFGDVWLVQDNQGKVWFRVYLGIRIKED